MTKLETTLTEEQLTTAFSALADEHVRKRQQSSAEQTWMLIRLRQQRTWNARARSRFSWLALASALSLAAAGAALAVGWSEPSLEYEVMGGTVEDRVIRTDAQPATLSFSDESYIQAEPRTTLSVNVVGAHKAVTRLSGGKLHVSVKHDASTDWRFLAGPYELRVIGTRFELAWDPNAERLSVLMHEGELLVSGANERTRSLRTGESLLLEKKPELAALAPPPSVPEAVDAPPADLEKAATGGKPQTAASTMSWAQLVAKGRFDEVVQAAEGMGVATALQRKDASELHALAQAARYAGHGSLALRAWQAVRQRFVGDAAATQAAFFLGRAYDEQGQAASALKWLDAYLAEAPAGVYASDALGRKLALVQRVQGPERAKAVAREYLKRFPGGSYAKTARDMLARE